jgi:5-methylthioadenosine/S-adenosylhomocysteine deaminase
MPDVHRYHTPELLTQDAGDRWLSPGVVDVMNGEIVAVGRPDEVPERPDAIEHRLDGALLPGFVNAHAHTPMVLLRGAGEGLPVDRWLTEVMWPREGRLSPEDIGWGMRSGAAQLLGGGVTTSVEMYFAADAMADAARDAGLRCLIAPPLLVAEGLDSLGTWEQQLEAAVDFAATNRNDPLIEGLIGPHSAYALPQVTLREAGRAAVAENLLLHLHVAEGEREGEGIRAEHGVSVPHHLEQLGVLEARVLAAHGVWLDDDDIALFAERGVAVAHCPSSNGKHASGLAPVTALRAAGVPVAIATDGPASHDRLDPFAEMRAAIHLARLRERDASVLGPREALRMATREAAVAIGRADLGAIEVGRRADMVLIDLGRPDLGPVVEHEDLLTHLVWSGSPAAVRSVWVEGRQVVADGEVLTIDVGRAAAEVTTRARRIATPR